MFCVAHFFILQNMIATKTRNMIPPTDAETIITIFVLLCPLSGMLLSGFLVDFPAEVGRIADVEFMIAGPVCALLELLPFLE